MKQHVRSFLTGAFWFAILVVMAGCQRADQSPLRIGFNTWIGYEAVILSDQNGFFEREGVNVHVYNFGSQYDVMRAFADGKIDIMFTSTFEVIELAARGETLKIIMVLDYSNGGDVVVAQTGFAELKDLKGKKIGAEVGSVSHFTAIKALEKAGLAEKDVTFVNISVDLAVKAFQSGALDAVATWDPYASQMTTDGAGHVVFSSREIPGQIVDVMAAREGLLRERPQDCRKAMVAYLKTLDWLKKNPRQGFPVIAKASGLSEAETLKAMDGVTLAGLDENASAFGRDADGSLLGVTRELIEFLYGKKLVANKPDATALIDATLIRGMLRDAGSAP